MADTLTLPTFVDLTPTSATIGCTSSEAEIILHAAARHTAPYDANSELDIINGVDAVWTGSVAPATVGINTFSVTGLTAGQDVYYGFVQRLREAEVLAVARKFRDYLKYYTISVISPVVVSTEITPTFKQMALLDITDDLEAGEYMLVVTWDWSMADVNDSALWQIISPAVTDNVYSSEPKAADDRIYRSTAHPITHAGGPISFLTQASRTAGATADLTIHRSSITFERKT